MPEKLPRGWVKVRLGELCLPVVTVQPEDSPDVAFTYFDIGGIDNDKNRIVETKSVTGRNAPSRARQTVRKDDILFSTVRTYLRKIARVEVDYPNPVASTGLVVVRAAEGVSSQFLFFQMLSEDFLQPLNALQTGSSYPAVRARDVFAQPIVLPPTREQEKIAAKLSAAFLGVERAETAARRAQKRLQRYCAALLDAAVTGELTLPWRAARLKNKETEPETGEVLLRRLLVARRARWEQGELRRLDTDGKAPKDDKWKLRYRQPVPPKTNELPEVPEGWTSISIDQLSWNSGYGTSAKCTYEADGPAVLRIPNIRNRTIDLADLKFAASFQDFNDEDFVAPGDLLLIRTNGSRDLIGRVAVVKATPAKKCGFASYLIRFRLGGDETIWSWVSLAWDSNVLRSSIESRAATTAGQYNVSLSSLADLAIPLPSTDEQTEIISQVERRLSAADRLATALEQQLIRASATRQLLLREAFAGRLVPQDANDESVSLLLKRVSAARESEAQKPKGKRMSKSKAKMKAAGYRSLLAVLKENGGPMTPEELFHKSRHSEESVDQFFAELRELTTSPPRIAEERKTKAVTLLKALP